MRFTCIILFCALLAVPIARADLDAAIDAYNGDDYSRAITQATRVLAGNPDIGDRLLATDILLSSRFFAGESTPALRDEFVALDRALADHHGQDAVDRLGALFILSDLQFQLGARDAAIRADVLIARIALKHPQDATEDLLWALRNLAIAFDDDAMDTRDSLAFAALFEFFAVDLLGSDANLSQEATAMAALALLRAGEDQRAAQKFFLYSFESWEAFADTDPEQGALAMRLVQSLEALPIADMDVWLAEVGQIHDTYLERERLAAEIGDLVEQGQLQFSSPYYLRALDKMAEYIAIAHPEDPLTAFYLNMILRSHLDIGDFAGARPYLAGLLSYPAAFSAVLDLPLGQLAGTFALRGGVEDALFEPLLQRAQALDRIVPSQDPDLTIDLALARGQIAQRQGRLTDAAQHFDRAIAIGATDAVRPGAVNRAYYGAASVAGELGRFDIARKWGLRLLENAQRTQDEDAASAAYTVLMQAALELGDPAGAVEFGRGKLSHEQGRGEPDAAAIGLAEIALAVAILNADGVSRELTSLLPRIFASTALDPEALQLRTGLMQATAERLQARPEDFADLPIFAAAPIAERASLAAFLAGAALESGDVETAIAWVRQGYDLAVRPGPAFLELTHLEGRLALQLEEPARALTAFRTITDHHLTAPSRYDPAAFHHTPFHIAAASWMADKAGAGGRATYLNEAFQMAQLAGTTRVGQALNASLLRGLADDGLQAKLRARQQIAQDLSDLRAAIDRASYDGRSANELRARHQDLKTEQDALTAQITTAAPELARKLDMATAAAPIDLAEAQSALGSKDLLLVYATSNHLLPDGSAASHLVALSRDQMRVAPLPARAELRDLADRLRCSAALTDPACSVNGRSGTRGSFSLDAPVVARGPVFDTALAYLAYQTFLAPVSKMLDGKTRLVVVPDQALATLPFHLMVKSPLPAGRPLRQANWVIRDHSVEIAPTVAGFVTQRRAGRARQGTRSFLGVGDPLIGVQQAGPIEYPCRDTRQPVTVAALTSSDLRHATGSERATLIAELSALPDTRCELTRIAQRFDDHKVLLHGDATETRIKQMNQTKELRRYSVLNFATHGLIAGEIGVNDSGLVLTPPRVATARDDGLLTTAEIAGLDLDADFVILSACNTGSGDSRNQEALSGLASAFFVAGAKSLLVSHWPVYSDAAVHLTTRSLDQYGPGRTQADALRLAMLSILDDPDAPARMQHPGYWAPFMVVGDASGSGK